MVRHTLKVLQQLLQDFQSEPDHFGTLRIKGLTDRHTKLKWFSCTSEVKTNKYQAKA